MILTDKQKEIIRNYYQIAPDEEIATMTGLSIPTVRKYAKLWNLGPKLARNSRRREWTEDEINFLIATKDTLSLKERAERLGRTPRAVSIKSSKLELNHRLGRTPVTLPPAQMQWLIDNYPYRTNKHLAEHLNVKVSTVSTIAKRLGLTKWRTFTMKPTQNKDQ